MYCIHARVIQLRRETILFDRKTAVIYLSTLQRRNVMAIEKCKIYTRLVRHYDQYSIYDNRRTRVMHGLPFRVIIHNNVISFSIVRFRCKHCKQYFCSTTHTMTHVTYYNIYVGNTHVNKKYMPLLSADKKNYY